MPKKRKRKISVNEFRKLSDDDIKNLSRKDAQEYIRQMRSAAMKQMEKLAAARERSDKFYSQAYENTKDWYEEEYNLKMPAPSRMKVSDAQEELSQLKKFFNAKSSTVPGAQKIAKEQDLRIFGPSASNPNKPAQRMSREEREAFWSAYNEFKIGADTSELFYRKYNQAQGELGQIALSRRARGEKISAAAMLKELREKLNEDEWIDDDEVSELSGDGDDFDYRLS